MLKDNIISFLVHVCAGTAGACVLVDACKSCMRVPSRSCDDVRAAASRPFVDVGDFQCDGNERTQHHLKEKPLLFFCCCHAYRNNVCSEAA